MFNEDPADNHGNGHRKALHFDHAPQRLVSLVPSMTESLFDLGVGEAVVGITDYCTQPAEKLSHLPRLGGPLNPQIERIIALQPELVIANWEENTLPDVEALEAAGVPVWVSFPKSVRETLDMLYTVAALFRSPAARVRLQTLDLTLDWAIASAAGRHPVRYFCPIWYETTPSGESWWMTFNNDTYMDDLLGLCGGENVFAGRTRRYPLEADLGRAPSEEPAGRDTRYPRVTLDEILAAQPEVILLPDEPYAYGETERQHLQALLSGTPAAREDRLLLVEGSLVTWHGTRLARALQTLPPILNI
jgi:iron complex transport system substrate-binding protein